MDDGALAKFRACDGLEIGIRVDVANLIGWSAYRSWTKEAFA
jgi:hypothetical protein